MTSAVRALIAASILALASGGGAQAQVDRAALLRAVEAYDRDAVGALGEAALPTLLDLYEESDEARRAKIANLLYYFSWRSDRARDLLLRDIHSTHPDLRIQAQYALGRVSGDDAVVDALLDNMRRGETPLFRDKAACALANDQVHLSDAQKGSLYAGLIDALGDEKGQVRVIAVQALVVLTGQGKGFRAHAPLPEREASIAAWRSWLDEYRRALPPAPRKARMRRGR